jgi:hypothetical protein
VPGERGYYVGFDSLPSSTSHGPVATSETVILVGEEGALRTYKVSRKNIDPIGYLEGLKGGVVGAKILQWTTQPDSAGSGGYPHVVLIIHGPVIAETEPALSSETSEDATTDGNGHRPNPPTAHATHADMRDVVRQYQTTVEIYSLSTRKHVQTIFRSTPVDLEYGLMGGADVKIPPPIGNLQVDANGRFLVVASGTSGEIFIFSPFSRGRKYEGRQQGVRCIGKLWTSVHERTCKVSAGVSSPGDFASTGEDSESTKRVPLFSLSQRWLATVPPPPESLFSVNGTALLAVESARPPGLATHCTPPKPTTTCGLDTPESESLVNKLSREVTQRFVKGANWMGVQSVQAWNSYWHGVQQSGPVSSHGHAADVSSHSFPPTHGHNQTPSTSPTQVAIFDLQRLLDAEEMKVKNALVPIATFEPPSGCSHISFAPSGLVLLTISRKGDIQFVWSLLRMQHPRAALTYDNMSPPHVRQVWKSTRITEATYVDVVWNSPRGNRFALLTEKGTIHMHEIPPTAFQWPPLRRARRQKAPPRPEYGDENDEPSSPSKGAYAGAMDTISGASAWLRKNANMRSRSLGSSAAFPPAMILPVGGKAVKAGFTKGVNLVANHANVLYNSDDNKLHMQDVTGSSTAGRMHWLTGRDRGSFGVVVNGSVEIYVVRTKSTHRKGMPPRIGVKVSKKRRIRFDLFRITDMQFAPAVKVAIESQQAGYKGGGRPRFEGDWIPRTPGGLGAGTGGRGRKSNWHSIMEAETNPPYQPFHTDRRISLCTYPDPEEVASSNNDRREWQEEGARAEAEVEAKANGSWRQAVVDGWLSNTHHAGLGRDMGNSSERWVFGDEITADKMLSGGGMGVDECEMDGEQMENQIIMGSGADSGRLVVRTVASAGRAEEFFEDGCEVVEFAEDVV